MQYGVDVDPALLISFGLAEELRDADTDWQRHEKHQILYAAGGLVRLEVEEGQWLLPPQRAAWISAGVRYRLRSSAAALRIVFLSPALVQRPVRECGVFSVTPLAREMLLFAMRWGPDRPAKDEQANRFFAALASLSEEWLEGLTPYFLPFSRSPELEKAMHYALEHLGFPVGIEAAADAAGVSPRTLARRFADETQSNWRQFLHAARLMKAMELLMVRGARVTEVAFAVGFESLGAFTRAFEAFTGECPKDYRRRVSESDPATPQGAAVGDAEESVSAD